LGNSAKLVTVILGLSRSCELTLGERARQKVGEPITGVIHMTDSMERS